MWLLLTPLAFAEIRCNDGSVVLMPDLCYLRGGVVESGVIEIGDSQTARVANGTERVADSISDLAKREATDARLTREAIMSLGAVLTDEMRASREWTLAGQQATLEVQGGLVPPSEYMARTREVYLENFQPVIWAAVLRARAARALVEKRRAYIVALVGEGHVETYEQFARTPGACVMEVASGAWILTGSETAVVKLNRGGARSISTDEGDVATYVRARAASPQLERCAPT